jgi:hypothetical protein
MAAPTLTVQISFVSTPLATAPTWVDVTDYVLAVNGVSIDRGRPSEFAVFSAGRCSFTLDNRDRRFDPSYSAGPYFGNLTPRKQMRVFSTYSAVDYPMFQGWVTGWPQSFPNPNENGTVTIEAIDGLAWLAKARLSSDAVYDYANTTIGSLVGFLRTCDGTRWVDAGVGDYSARLGCGPTVNPAGSIAAGVFSNSVPFSTGAPVSDTNTWVSEAITGAAGVWTASGPYTVAFWFKTTKLATLWAGYYPTGGPNGCSIFTDSAGKISVSTEVAGVVGGTQTNTTPAIVDGLIHHFAFTATTAAVGGTIYIDGVAVPSTISGSTNAGFSLGVLGNCYVPSVTRATGFQGQMMDVAFWNKILSASEIATFYNLSRGYLEETADVRANRILDHVGWPAAWRDITTDPESVCGQLIYNTRTSLSALQDVERTEQGRLFASKTNAITLQARYFTQEVTRGNTVQVIFSDDGADAGYETLGFEYTELDVQNDITVTTPTYTTNSRNSTSITAVGRQSETVATLLTNSQLSADMAAGLVYQRKDPSYRSAPIRCNPGATPSLWAAILGLELGDRIRLEVTPAGVGSQHVEVMTVEQISWRLVGRVDVEMQWEITVQGSPVHTGFFMIDSSSVDGPDFVGY